MIGTLDISISACKPNMPLQPVYAYKDSPQSLRIRNVPKSIGKWNITSVYLGVLYPNNTTSTVTCVKEGSVYVGTFSGSTISGTVKDGLTVYADGKDENNSTVTGYVLGVADIYIISSDGTVQQGGSTVHFHSSQPSTAYIGDMFNDNGIVKVYNGTTWISPLTKTSQLTNDSGFSTTTYVDNAVTVETNQRTQADTNLQTQINLKADADDIPTKTSDLTNDSNFITSTQVVPCSTVLGYAENAMAAYSSNYAMKDGDGHEITSTYATKSEVPTKTSDLTNDSNFITSAQVVPSATNTGYAQNAVNASYAINATSSYTATNATNDEQGNKISETYATKSEVPSKTSDLTNDNGFITSTQVVPSQSMPGYAESAVYSTETSLATIAVQDVNGNAIISTYATKSYVDTQVGTIETALQGV